MKKLLLLTSLMAAITFTSVTTAIAQTDSTVVGTGTGEGTVDPFAAIFLSVASLSLIILPVTGWIVTHVVKVNAQIMSWVVAIALSCLGHYLALGAFADYNWFWTIGYGIIAALTANGMADTSLIKGILSAIAAKAKV